MFGSMLRARSWIDRRMLASPGVDLRREDDSSVTHVSSLGFFNADGVPFQIQKHIRRAKQNKQQLLVSLEPVTLEDATYRLLDPPIYHP